MLLRKGRGIKNSLLSCLVMLSLSASSLGQTNSGKSITYNCRNEEDSFSIQFVQRSGEDYILWSNGKIGYVLDEETARKMGYIQEQFDEVATRHDICQRGIIEARSEIQTHKNRILDLENEVKECDAKCEKEKEILQGVITSLQDHVEVVENAKTPSRFRSIMIGVLIGLGVGGFIGVIAGSQAK